MDSNRYHPSALNDEVEQALAARTETIDCIRFTDLGRTGTRIEYGKPDHDGDYPACVLPRQIPEALRAMGTAGKCQTLRWFGVALPPTVLEMIAALEAPTLGQRIKATVRTIRGGKDGSKNGDTVWLATQCGITEVCAGYYLRDMRVPTRRLAAKLAQVLGWSPEYMEQLLREARLRRAMKEGR